MRILALLAALLVALPAWAGEVVVDFLDVGQGDAVLIRGGGKTVLIDASVKAARVAAKLQRLGIGRLDLVVATHPHADHVGGMEEVLRGFDVGLYMDNGLPHTTATYEALMVAVEERGIPYKPAMRGTTLRLGEEATFTVLFPDTTPLRETRSDLNSNSVVMRLDHGEISFLFTGDAEEPTEEALLHNGLQPVDVLKVAHHGSGHSSSAAFLAAASPDVAVISCGTGNRYKHPYPDALERLASAGATVYRTDLSGTIRAVSDGKVLRMEPGALPELQDVAPPSPKEVPSRTAVAVARYDGPAAEPPTRASLSGVQAPVEDYDDVDLGPKRCVLFCRRKEASP